MQRQIAFSTKERKKNSFYEDLCRAMKRDALVRGNVRSAAVVSCHVSLQNEPEKAKNMASD